jgi:hypothetical protein
VSCSVQFACDELEELAHDKTVSDGKLCRCSSICGLEGRENDEVLFEHLILPREIDRPVGGRINDTYMLPHSDIGK